MKKIVLFTFFYSSSVIAGLTPSDLLEKTIKHNQKVRLAYHDYEIALAEKGGAKKDLDWNIALAGYIDNANTKQNVTYDNSSVREIERSYSLGFSKKFMTGTSLQTSYQAISTSSSSRNAIASTYYQSAFQVGLEQPLLKDSVKESYLNELMKADYKIKRYIAKYYKTLTRSYTKVVEKYLDYITKSLEYKNRKKSILFYAETLKYTQAAYKAGRKAKVDLVEVNAKLKREEALLLKNQSELNILSNDLISLCSLRIDRENVSEQDLIDFFKLLSNFNKKENKPGKLPSVVEKLMSYSETNVDIEKYRNQLFPELNLEVTYTGQGLGTSSTIASDQVRNFDYAELSVALTLNWAIENLSSRGHYQRYQAIGIRKNLDYQKELFQEKNRTDVDVAQNIAKLEATKLKKEMYLESLALLEFHSKNLRLGKISFLKYEEENNSIQEDILSYYETLSDTSLSLFKLWVRRHEYFEKARKFNGLSFVID